MNRYEIALPTTLLMSKLDGWVGNTGINEQPMKQIISTDSEV